MNSKLTAKLIVDDNGTGLGADAMKQMFDPFFTEKETGKGLGLGLSISYNIVRDFGGTISAENRPEGGARFIVDWIISPQVLMALWFPTLGCRGWTGCSYCRRSLKWI